MSFSRYEIYNGKSLSDWSKETGIKLGTLSYRINKGWSLEKAISTPVMTQSEAASKHESVLGKTYTDRFGNKFNVTEIAFRDAYSVAHYKCVFINTGYETTALASQIRGQCSHVFDRFSPSVHGVGCMGNAYRKDNPKLFEVWRAMIARCYNPKNPSYKTYGAKGVQVCEKWKRFDWFLEDVPKIKGYNQKEIDQGNLVLDKDIINRKAKLYSLETCCFVSRSENTKESARRTWKERKV